MPDLPPPIPPSVPEHSLSPYGRVYPYNDPRKTDSDHLALLSIFSYVSAGLALLGVAFLGLQFRMMTMVMSNPEIFRDAQKHGGPNPAVMFGLMLGAFRWFFVALALWGVGMAGLNVAAGYFLGQRRQRTFCMVVAAFNCLRLPLGTALGVFTLIVLSRDSVRRLYEGGKAISTAAPSDKLPS